MPRPAAHAKCDNCVAYDGPGDGDRRRAAVGFGLARGHCRLLPTPVQKQPDEWCRAWSEDEAYQPWVDSKEAKA